MILLYSKETERQGEKCGGLGNSLRGTRDVINSVLCTLTYVPNKCFYTRIQARTLSSTCLEYSFSLIYNVHMHILLSFHTYVLLYVLLSFYIQNANKVNG